MSVISEIKIINKHLNNISNALNNANENLFEDKIEEAQTWIMHALKYVSYAKQRLSHNENQHATCALRPEATIVVAAGSECLVKKERI